MCLSPQLFSRLRQEDPLSTDTQGQPRQHSPSLFQKESHLPGPSWAVLCLILLSATAHARAQTGSVLPSYLPHTCVALGSGTFSSLFNLPSFPFPL